MTMHTLDSQLTQGKYKGHKVRSVLRLDPDFLFRLYTSDPDFDLHLDVIRAMEIRGFNMRRATLIKLRSLCKTI